jgi:hypothetical protein
MENITPEGGKHHVQKAEKELRPKDKVIIPPINVHAPSQVRLGKLGGLLQLR